MCYNLHLVIVFTVNFLRDAISICSFKSLHVNPAKQKISMISDATVMKEFHN